MNTRINSSMPKTLAIKLPSRQRGITLMGFIIVASVLGFLFWLEPSCFRLTPNLMR